MSLLKRKGTIEKTYKMNVEEKKCPVCKVRCFEIVINGVICLAELKKITLLTGTPYKPHTCKTPVTWKFL